MDFLDGWIQGDGNNIQVGLWRTYDLSFGVITLAQKWTISFRKGRKRHTQNNHDNFTLHFCLLVLYIWAHALLECTLSWVHVFLSAHFLQLAYLSARFLERTLSGAHAFTTRVIERTLSSTGYLSARLSWAEAFLSARFLEYTFYWAHSFLSARFLECTLSLTGVFERTLSWAHSFFSARFLQVVYLSALFLECMPFQRTPSWAHTFLSARFLQRMLSSAHAFFSSRFWAHASLMACLFERTLFFSARLLDGTRFRAHAFLTLGLIRWLSPLDGQWCFALVFFGLWKDHLAFFAHFSFWKRQRRIFC